MERTIDDCVVDDFVYLQLRKRITEEHTAKLDKIMNDDSIDKFCKANLMKSYVTDHKISSAEAFVRTIENVIADDPEGSIEVISTTTKLHMAHLDTLDNLLVDRLRILFPALAKGSEEEEG